MTEDQGAKIVNLFQGLLLDQQALTKLLIQAVNLIEFMAKQRGDE